MAECSDMNRSGDPRTTHPDDLLGHLRAAHFGSLNAIPDDTPSDVLEMAHAQRHAGFGVGADHAADDHDSESFI